MSDQVPRDQIERLVGARRHPTRHLARAVSAEQTVYILHSQECRDNTPDLRDCPFSLALDRGIEHHVPRSGWRRVPDRPVRVEVFRGWLVPDLMAVRASVEGGATRTPAGPDARERAAGMDRDEETDR